MASQAELAFQAAYGSGSPAAPSAPASAPANQAQAAFAAAYGPAAQGDAPRAIVQQATDAFSALGHHLMKPLHGAAQFVENTVASGAAKLPSNPVSRYIMETAARDNQALAEGEKQYQASVPDSAGAYVGATVGEIAPFVMGGAAGKLQQAGDYIGPKVAAMLPQWASKAAPLASKIGSGATQGAIVGAAQPVTNAPGISDLVTGADTSYWGQKANDMRNGALIGGVVPVGVAGLQKGYQVGKNALAPLLAPKNVVAPAIEGMAPGGIPQGGQLVEGSTPTLAQVLATPDAVAAEKVMRNNPQYRSVFENLDSANNEARIAAVEKIAQTPEALAKALEARGEATAPMIEKLLNNPKTSQPVRAKDVLSAVDKLENSSFSTDPVIKKTLSAVRKQIEDASAKTDVASYTYTPSQLAAIKKGEAYVRPDLLDGIRQNLRNIISDNSSTGAVSSKQQAGLEPLANHITSAIDAANPGYRSYLATYAEKSKPINTMEAARSLLDNVGGLNRSLDSSGTPAVTLSRYSTELAKALKNSPHGIDPAAQKTLEAVQADLQRASISNSLKSAGSDTKYNLSAPDWLTSKLYGDSFAGNTPGAKLAGALAGGAGGFLTGGGFGAAGGATAGAGAAGKVAQIGQKRVNELYAKALADPKFAAELIDGINAKNTSLPEVLNRSPQLAALLLQQGGQK